MKGYPESICGLGVAITLALSGCSQTTGQNEAAGTGAGLVAGALAGGVVGQAVGGQNGAIVGSLVGAAAGGVIGNRIGRELDERDRAMREAALQRAMAVRVDQPAPRVTWRNPVTKNRGRIERTRTFEQGGRNCAVFVEAYDKQGVASPYTDQYTRCANPDGSF